MKNPSWHAENRCVARRAHQPRAVDAFPLYTFGTGAIVSDGITISKKKIGKTLGIFSYTAKVGKMGRACAF